MTRSETGKTAKIAVLLPGKFAMTDGMGRTAAMLCDALLKTGPDLRVVFGTNLPPEKIGPMIGENNLGRLEIRSLHWSAKDGPDGTRWIRPQSIDGYDYMDCDAWVFWRPPVEAVIAPLRPYAIFFADLLARVVPRAHSYNDQNSAEWAELVNCIRSHQCANMVFCTAPRSIEDVVGFLGVPRSRVCLAPQFAPSGTEALHEAPSPVPYQNYFLWTTNGTPHKNHLRAFQMLDIYYSRYPGEALPVVITGVNTLLMLHPESDTLHPYHKEISAFLKGKEHILKNVYFAGTLKRPEFIGTLKGAAFLWHNVIYDNGTASVLEAAEYGVPSLATDYPQMRFFDAKYGTKARFFSAFDVEGGAQALIEITRNARNGGADPVSINYEDENAKYYDWVKWLVAYLAQQEANFVACEAKADAAFSASKAGADFAANATKVWPPLKPYVAAFPWSDVPVACLLVSHNSKGPLERLIEGFEAALREHYINFKLLVLLPDDGKSLENFKAILISRVLGFDFLYAGLATNSADVKAAGSLAQVVFSDTASENQRAISLRDTPVRLDESLTPKALAASIVQELSAIRPRNRQEPNLSPGGETGDKKRKAVDAFCIPKIMVPPAGSNISIEALREYVAWLNGISRL